MLDHSVIPRKSVHICNGVVYKQATAQPKNVRDKMLKQMCLGKGVEIIQYLTQYLNVARKYGH